MAKKDQGKLTGFTFKGVPPICIGGRLSAVSSAKDAASIGNANMVIIARVLQNHSRNKNQPVRIFYNLEDENKKLIFSESTSQLLLPIVIRFRLESPGSEC